MYKFNKQKVRTYYKYQNWTQPTLTSNGTMGTSNFACYAQMSVDTTHQDAYLAFSPNTGYVKTDNNLAVSTLYIFFESKNPLLISKLSFHVPIVNTQNDHNGGWAEKIYLHGANENGAWEQIGYIAGGADMGNKTHTMTLSSNTKAYKLFRLQGTTKGAGHNDELDISQIQITAKEAVVSNSNSYDFYTEKDVYKAVKKPITKYYKYEYTNFVQPVLTENGTMGSDNFAVASNVAQYGGAGVYFLLDNNPLSAFHSNGGVKTGYIDLYNPNALKITNILVNNQNSSGSSNRASSAGNVYGRNKDTEDWVLISSYTNNVQGINEQWNIDLSSNANYYKYYRVESTANGGANYWTIGEWTLTADERLIVEGTEQDHDFYKNKYTYYGIKDKE